MANNSDYPLTIEILIDHPYGADLKKGQICKAKKRVDGPHGYFVFDDCNSNDYPGDWSVPEHCAKVVE